MARLGDQVRHAYRDMPHYPPSKALKRVTQALAESGAILITGPANAKTELAAYMKQAQPKLAERISAVETLDHPTDGALVALGRKFFRADDRMHPQPHRCELDTASRRGALNCAFSVLSIHCTPDPHLS